MLLHQIVQNHLVRKVSRVITLSLLLCAIVFVPAFASSSDDVLYREVETVSTDVLRISAQDTSGFHAVVLGLLGDYNPIAVTTSYQYPSGQTYQTRYQVDVEPDWSWICTAAIFVVIIFCLFRLIGGLFAWKR